ncbi:Endonuclease III [Candidatus Nitrosomarinus catalina]|jgi:N-glycosylase/DNA lyase|uniref:DNA-(apurinic or apyrimidinic site) lyase n=1 Tax=Candidatus Nitrosomarinus catalinensis TaxID=1898749 RepID=A0A2Z2HI11_9ARCH|nr:DNA glycosylase [Candidatus Nitrosomarinus catalina]ARS63851.1 Endonuclease III [Candidatus Nitrosomarinus catalina]
MKNKFTIDIDNSINSGQVFLWKKIKKNWYGIDGQNILKISQGGKIESIQNTKTDFFRKNDDIQKIIKSISKDKTVKKAIRQYEGLRLFNQDPFQCMISFIISSNSNIQKIKNSLEKISKKFGTKLVVQNEEFYLFPRPEKIARASIDEIKICGVGYRAPFIKEAAKMVTSKKINFEYLKNSDYNETKRNLRLIPGVGNKVADCIMLFSLNKLDAFPLDTWMIKILEKYYSNEFHIETKTITEKQYEILHKKIVDYFGQYCGYAQQFLFKMERENYEKKWL